MSRFGPVKCPSSPKVKWAHTEGELDYMCKLIHNDRDYGMIRFTRVAKGLYTAKSYLYVKGDWIPHHTCLDATHPRNKGDMDNMRLWIEDHVTNFI